MKALRLNDITTAELIAIRNAFDSTHRIKIEARHAKYAGENIKEPSIEFSPIDTVQQCLIHTVEELIKDSIRAAHAILDLSILLLDTAHNFAINLLDWAGLHQFVLHRFDQLIAEHKEQSV